jgi:hypothetical protein
MSLGINDVIPGEALRKAKEENVAQAYAKCDELIAKAKLGKLENRPGCDQEQTLEAMIGSVLSEVRDKVGGICMKQLSRYNAPLIMATAGSKGLCCTQNTSPHANHNPYRFHHQRFANGCLRGPTNDIRQTCSQWFPRSISASLSQEVERSTIQRFRAQ